MLREVISKLEEECNSLRAYSTDNEHVRQLIAVRLYTLERHLIVYSLREEASLHEIR